MENPLVVEEFNKFKNNFAQTQLAGTTLASNTKSTVVNQKPPTIGKNKRRKQQRYGGNL